MAQLPTTGPEALRLRWGQETEDRDGRRVRAFNPDSAFQEPEGYLHGGTAAAAVLSAARLLLPGRGEPTAVSVSIRRPVPLGDELEVVLDEEDDGARVTIQRRLPPDREVQTLEPLVEGAVRLAGFEASEDLADARQLAGVPIPEPEEHELFADCYVCGQKNGQGLQLLPGWHAPDRVVVSFNADDRYDDGTGRFSPEAACALLSCPTLWAVHEQLDGRPEEGALLASYEVRFHSLPRLNSVLRTVGWAGSTERHTEFTGHLEGRQLHGLSALVDEDGGLHATASATWITVDELPSREPGRPAPISEEMPTKAGRAERSPDDWGESSPGRREVPGPRSWRPGSEPEPGRGAGQRDFEEKGTPREPKKGHPRPQDQEG